MAAKKILVPYDFNKLETQNMRTHNLAAAPSSPGLGQRYYNTADNTEYYWNGAWIPTDAQKRTGIPLSNLATDPLARSNHTGTQLAATISDLATTVKAYRHDEFAAPTAAVSWGNQKITNLADPTAAQDAATKNYVDTQIQSAAAGIDCKASVRVVANANITLSGTQTIDGISVVAGDRVLVRGQTTASQNGVYVCAAGAWSRATDSDATGEITPGAFWFVEEGATYGKSQWRIENSGAITVGTTGITINQFGAASGYVEGNGVDIVGNVLSVEAAVGGGLVVNASGVGVDTTMVVRKYAALLGDGAATSIVVTHSLSTQDVTVQVRDASTNNVVECDIQATSANTVTLGFAIAPASNALRVVVHG